MRHVSAIQGGRLLAAAVGLAGALAALAAANHLLAPSCLAAGAPPPRQEPANNPLPPAQPSTTAAPSASEARAQAEALYAKGYTEAQEAKADLTAGKEKDAKKKFAKALKRFDSATRLDEKYFEAWNMVGFCARKTGDLKRAFAAYEKSLAINPDYEEAHEYLGEAYLMSGNIAKAKDQLAWLKSRKSEEAEELEEEIEAAEGKSAKAP